MEQTNVKVVKVRSLGWLRRPELDHPDIEARERPDGMLYAHSEGQGEPSVAIRARRLSIVGTL